MYIPNVFDQYNGTSFGVLNPSTMAPRAMPGGPVRNPDGVEKITRHIQNAPTTLQGATMRSKTMRIQPCEDIHFHKTFRPGKFKGSAMPLMNQYGNFRNQQNAPQQLLKQPYIQFDNPLLRPADVYNAGLNSSIPVS